MNEDKTQPELVWFNGRWFLKSVVDRVTAEWEAEKAEAKRKMIADAEVTRAEDRRAKAQWQARKGEVPKGGPANPPSGAQTPESPKPILSGPIKPKTEAPRVEANRGNAGIPAGESMVGEPISGAMPYTFSPAGMPAFPGSDQPSHSTADPRPSLPISDPIKVEAKSAAEEKRGQSILSDQIKAEAEVPSDDCNAPETRAKCSRDAGPGGGLAARPWSGEISKPESVLSDQIKAEAEEAEQESGEATPGNAGIPAGESVVGEPIPGAMPYTFSPARMPALAGSDQIKAEAHFSRRKGKIAGLPEAIREALNERLENGEEGKALLDWLNGLPEVKRFLAAEFEGAPILEQNLSAWRKGGYADWLERNAVVEVGLRLQENVTEWKEAGDLDLPQALGHWLTGQYALATRNMGDLQGDKKWALLWRVGRGVMRLRQVQEQGEKLKLAEARFAWKQEREAKRAEERAIVRALRAEEKAKRPRRREPTEEETEEAAQECREIFKPETEEDLAYYYKLRRDAEVADALARGEEPPPEPEPEEPSWTHVTKGKYF